jgi:hypothetical protein
MDEFDIMIGVAVALLTVMFCFAVLGVAVMFFRLLG